MKFFYFFLFFMLVACGKPTESETPISPAIYRLEATRLSNYMIILPQILNASHTFLKTEEGKASAKDPDNRAFYQYVFRQNDLKTTLNNIGFTNELDFGTHHEYIVALYLKLGEDPEVLNDAKTILPAMSKEKDALVLRLSRDEKNTSLKKLVDDLDSKEAFYQNVQLMAPYMPYLDSLNK